MDELDSVTDVTIMTRGFIPITDEAFIYATWRNSKFYGTPDLKKAKNPKEVFRQLTSDIRGTLKYAEVQIACLEEDPKTIIGYVVFTETHLDWIYVKDTFRKAGIATMLMPKNIKTYPTQPTKIGQAILEKNKEKHGTARDNEEQKETK